MSETPAIVRRREEMRHRRPSQSAANAGPWPWLDRFGRFSPLRFSVLIALMAPGLVLLALLADGAMGAEPWKAATREAGSHAAHILLISLAVTPLRFVADWPKAATLRRMVGLAALAYALLHLLLYAGHLGWNLLAVASEIVLRIYLTLGFVVLLGLCVLGRTSTDGWQARLGRRWGRLHRWVYLLAAGAVLHAFLQSRARADAAVILAGCYVWLMLWRLLSGRWRTHPPALLALALAAALGAAAVEFAWYAAATNLPAWRILAANLSLEAGWRPAQTVLLAGFGVALLPLVRRAA
ncbi:MAG TPA: ferric reductase-like transmembrane domain-containing protein [Falsiroseomonas sp.]|nr:ferric reductase-like transmembrane domain-containing protein [Falsiroseomonas sp.]